MVIVCNDTDPYVCQILSVPLAYTDVQRASRRDPVISRVLRYTQKGWPAKFSIVLKPFSHHRNELTALELKAHMIK